MIQIHGTIVRLPVQLLSSVLQSAACGVSGFLMSLIMRNREVKTVVVAAVIAAIFHVIYNSMFFPPQSQFIKVYWLLGIILDIIFLLGFAVFGAWLFTRGNRLKMHKVEDGVH